MNLSISYGLCAHSHNKRDVPFLFYLVFYLYASSESNVIILEKAKGKIVVVFQDHGVRSLLNWGYKWKMLLTLAYA